MNPKLTIPQCQEILHRMGLEVGGSIFTEMADSISGEVRDLELQLLHKNETANVFMNQVKKLQVENAELKSRVEKLIEDAEMKEARASLS